jgi:hypothetical protein
LLIVGAADDPVQAHKGARSLVRSQLDGITAKSG